MEDNEFTSVTGKPIGSFLGQMLRYSIVALCVWGLATAGNGAGLTFFSAFTNFTNVRINFQSYLKSSAAFQKVGKPEYVYAVSKEDNVLTLAAYKELLNLDISFRSLVTTDGYYFDDLCLRVAPTAPCLITSSPLSFWTVGPNTYDLSEVISNEQLLSWINSGKDISGAAVNTLAMFGDPTPLSYENADGSNSIRTAKAVVYAFSMSGADNLDSIVSDYEDKLQDFFQSFNKNSMHINAYKIDYNIFDRDVPQMISDDMAVVLILGLQLILCS